MREKQATAAIGQPILMEAYEAAFRSQSRTVGQIVRANVFTRFNAILGTMLALILVFGSAARDYLFGTLILALVATTIIGTPPTATRSLLPVPGRGSTVRLTTKG